jgi:hypothetical protein
MRPTELDAAIAERAHQLAALEGDRNSVALNVKHALKLARSGWKPDPIITKAQEVYAAVHTIRSMNGETFEARDAAAVQVIATAIKETEERVWNQARQGRD